ncbi:MAG TPA: HNH endonuclease signature motif containing protein [Polyangiaceae bacterium]|nr:HNH endonuclease signature motif containing protein [Polyangiaceae bacterium]
MAEALEELPVIAQALATGVLNWSAARELTRVDFLSARSAGGVTSMQTENLYPSAQRSSRWPSATVSTSGVIAPPVAAAEPAKDESAHVGAEAADDESAHVGARRVRAIGGVRAKQTVSPETRRAVWRRDHEQCAVPGCRNARFLDVHHVALRSEGGAHDADNLTTLCGAHHRAAHHGELVVSGSVASGIRFRHADGSDYGEAPEPSAVEVQAKAFGTLRSLGFREGEIRRALAESCKLGVPETTVDRIVRDALARLTPRCAHV